MNSLGAVKMYFSGVHRNINVSTILKDYTIGILPMLPDTGAYLTVIKKKDLKSANYTILSDYQSDMKVGGIDVRWKLARLNKIFLGRLQITDVIFALSENSEVNLLGANILECIDPLFEYSKNLMHYTRNNGNRPLAEIRPEWACGKVYLQSEFESNKTSLTEDEEKVLALVKIQGKVRYDKSRNSYLLEPRRNNYHEIYASLVSKGFLIKDGDVYSINNDL